MDATREANDEQATIWNGTSAGAWVQAQELVDQVLKPFEGLLVEAVRALSPRRVLDIGCGTGNVTVALAKALGPESHCVGVDISEQMVTAAQARNGARTSFIRADAQVYDFEPASFDAVVSRFGVMFFDDFVGAYRNLRHAAKEGADLRFVVWRSAEENAFMTAAERAAAPLVPDLPARQPDAPGQFGLASAGRTRRLLEDSGWTGVDIQPVDAVCTMPESALERYFTLFGPLGRVLPNVDDQTRARVVETVRAAFDPFVDGAEVRFDAACWLVAATNGR